MIEALRNQKSAPGQTSGVANVYAYASSGSKGVFPVSGIDSATADFGSVNTTDLSVTSNLTTVELGSDSAVDSSGGDVTILANEARSAHSEVTNYEGGLGSSIEADGATDIKATVTVALDSDSSVTGNDVTVEANAVQSEGNSLATTQGEGVFGFTPTANATTTVGETLGVTLNRATVTARLAPSGNINLDAFTSLQSSSDASSTAGSIGAGLVATGTTTVNSSPTVRVEGSSTLSGQTIDAEAGTASSARSPLMHSARLTSRAWAPATRRRPM